MNELAEKPTGVALLITAARLTIQNWRYLVWVSLPAFVAVLGLVIVVQNLTEGDISSPPTWLFLAFSCAAVVLIFLVLITNAIGWHRLLAQHGPQNKLMPVLRKLPYWSYIWRAGCLSIPAFFVALIIGLPIDLTYRSLLESNIPLSNLAFWVVNHTEAYVRDWLAPFLISATLTLIGFAFPAVALGHKTKLWTCIKANLTYAPQMMFALILLEITTFMVIEVAGTHLRYLFFGSAFYTSAAFSWGALALTNVFSALSLMIKIAILTTAYLHWHAQQKRPAEADL